MRIRLLFLLGVLVIYACVLFAFDGLRFEIGKDEVHFWPTSVQFSRTLIPSLEQLRGYDELNTPLPFVIFGMLEHLFGGGIAVGRAVNFVLSMLIVLLIGLPRGKPLAPRMLCALGLLSFPYYLGASIYLYTDLIAAACVVLGLHLHLGRRYWWSALALALGIASRQYMVAFPVGLLGFEWLRALRLGERPGLACLAPALAAATLLGWIAFFGGLAPATAVRTQDLKTAKALQLYPDHALYLFTCVGAYFVIPEFLLLGGWRRLRGCIRRPSRRSLAMGLLVILLFALFPPLRNPLDYDLPTMGFLDRFMRLFLGDASRVLLFCALALLCAGRFRRWSLASALILANALVLTKAHIAWDKYALALIVCLWYLRSREGESPVQQPGS